MSQRGIILCQDLSKVGDNILCQLLARPSTIFFFFDSLTNYRFVQYSKQDAVNKGLNRGLFWLAKTCGPAPVDAAINADVKNN